MSFFKKNLLILIIFSISFDIFLVTKIGLATIRASDIMVFTFGLIVIFEEMIRGKITFKILKYPMLPVPFLVLASFVSISGSELPCKSIVCSFLIVFNFIFYFWLLVNSIHSEKNLRFFLKVYIFSFLFVSFFALYQFVAPFFGFTPYLANAFFASNIPRVNAFTYEPGCLATYLMPGLVLALFWRKNNVYPLLSSIAIVILSTVIVLTTSRAGWVGLILIVVFFVLLPVFISMFIRRTKKISLAVIGILIFVIILLSPIIYFFRDSFYTFASSLSSDNFSASFGPRFQGIADSLEIFYSKPIFGAGIGALGAHILNRPDQFAFPTYADPDFDVWNIGGTNVATEILASLGIVGFFCWVWLIYRFIKYGYYLISKTTFSLEWRSTLEGLLMGFIIQLIVLQFNQNFFRAYVILHMGLTLSTCCVVQNMISKNLLVNKNSSKDPVVLS